MQNVLRQSHGCVIPELVAKEFLVRYHLDLGSRESGYFMNFYSFSQVRNLLKEGKGRVEVVCTIAPTSITNAIAGEWEFYFLHNEKSDQRIPIVTSGQNPHLKRATRVHGLFAYLQSYELSPIEIPTIPGDSCLQTYRPQTLK